MSRIDEVAIQYLFMVLANRLKQIKLDRLWFEVDISANLVRAPEIRSQNTGISTEISSKIRSDIEFISLLK